MKGRYIYCIRLRGGDVKKVKTLNSGVNLVMGQAKSGGLGPIQMIAFKDLEAVASEVDISVFNAKTIKNRLREDAKWTEKNVKDHHAVVAEAAKFSAVIPMKFGVLFKTKKSLEAMLKKHYRKFKNLLTHLKNKQEWGVKGYLEYKKFVEILKNKNKEVRKLEKKRSSISEGMRWYVDRKSDELIAGQIEYEVGEELRRIVNGLEKYAEEIRLNDLLPKEISELGKDMVLNAACLVRDDRLNDFQSLIREIAKEYDAVGITLILTGPWPPYNFVD